MPIRVPSARLFPLGPSAARSRRNGSRGGPVAAAERLEDRVLLSAVGSGDSDPVPGSAAPAAVDFGSLGVDRRAYAADRIVVRFRGDGPADIEKLERRGARELMAGSGLWLVGLREGRDVRAARAAWAARPDVRYAQFDHRVFVGGVATTDPSYTNGALWGLNNTGQNGGRADADIDAPEAWEVTVGTGGTVVAVIDSGIDYTHPDLRANMWVNAGEIAGNGKDDDRNGYVDDVYGYDFANGDGDPMDDDGHGTHVAGTIGAVADGAGVVGVARNVRLMALKFLDATGYGSLSAAVSALNYAVSMGAHVSNNSWSGGGFDRALADAIKAAAGKGHIFVAAAGNRGKDNDASPTYPANYAFDNVVSVAATDRNDRLASFSNYGAKTVDLAAPGVAILSTVPKAVDTDGTRDGYAYFDGTSMAAPHVTGAIVLVRDANPGLTYRQVIGRVLANVDPVAGLAGKTLTGGRLNAAKAVGPGTAATTPPADEPADDTTAPTVTLTSPNGGQTWAAGTVQTVAWSASDAVGVASIDLYFSADGGATYALVAYGLANDGAYAWTVPNTPTTDARLRVVARDAAGNSAADASDAAFTVVGAMTVLAADGFESGGFSGGTGWVERRWTRYGDADVVANGGPSQGAYHARLRRGTGDLERSVSLTGRTDAKLRFRAKVNSFEGTDRAWVLVSADRATWRRVSTFSPMQSDNVYRSYEVDLSAYSGAARLYVAFDARMNGTDDRFFIDTVQVVGRATGSATTADASAADIAATADPAPARAETADTTRKGSPTRVPEAARQADPAPAVEAPAVRVSGAASGARTWSQPVSPAASARSISIHSEAARDRSREGGRDADDRGLASAVALARRSPAAAELERLFADGVVDALLGRRD